MSSLVTKKNGAPAGEAETRMMPAVSKSCKCPWLFAQVQTESDMQPYGAVIRLVWWQRCRVNFNEDLAEIMVLGRHSREVRW